MEETKKISLKCPDCGQEFQCKAPAAAGVFSVECINPDCKRKIVFNYQIKNQEETEAQKEINLGLQADGSYRFKCVNQQCGQVVLVPKKLLKFGKNTQYCPKCKTQNEFEIEPTEEDLLKCQTLDCEGVLTKPDGQDGIYPAECNKCGQQYSLFMQNGKVVKVNLLTPLPAPQLKPTRMKLVLSKFIGKKEYELRKGVHYIGREDDELTSDFVIKDKYASKRSLRIDVNENAGRLVYKLTVERALNPVFHNNQQLAIGDIVYLNFGDTIKLGKTLLTLQKL